MEKFSYGLEFYESGIFSLKNSKLFQRKINEAKKVEEYFQKYGINTEYVRPYILYSYRLNKSLNAENRIRYVKGLIYANDYISFEDLENANSDLEMIESISSDDEDNQSLWAYNGFLASVNNEDFIEETSDEEYMNIIDETNNVVSLDPEIAKQLTELLNNELDKNNDDEDIEDEEEIEEDIPIKYVSFEDKLNLFKSKSNIYIDKTIGYKLNDNLIDESDVKMVKKAMKDWFKIIFNAMEDLVKIEEKILKYNDKNIIKYL